MLSKTCKKCGVSLPVTDFYAHPKAKDGRQASCKECTKAAVRANRKLRVEYYRKYDRQRSGREDRVLARAEYQATPAGKAALRDARRRFLQKNPVVRAATTVVSNAVRDGRLRKLPCQVCGAKDSQAHHAAYSLPLAVTWLCKRHHDQLHREHRERMRSI